MECRGPTRSRWSRRRTRRPTAISRGRLQPEADAAYRLDPRMIAELLTQRRDMRVDRLGRTVPVRIPDRLEDLRPRVNCADVVGQECQQVELLGGQRNLITADANAARSTVQLHRPDGLRAGHVARTGLPVDRSPTHRTDASDQLAKAEWFRDVVVRAELEPEHSVELLASRSQHDDGRRGPFAQLSTYIAAVHIRKPEVEQDQFVAVFRKCAGAGCNVGDRVARRGQAFDERVGDRSVVLHQQQLHVVIVTRVPTPVRVLGQILDIRRPSLGGARRTVVNMKTRVAMMISIAGVLVAGSAAALVNTQVLSGNADATPFEAQATATLEPSTTVVASAPPDTSTVTTVAAVTSAPVDSTVAGAPATQAVYAIGDSMVTIDTAGDALTIVNLTPAAGWTVTKSEAEDANNVEIKLQSGTTELEFHANLLFGVVSTSVETHDASTTASSVEDNHGGGGHGADDSGGHGGDD